MGSFLRCIKYRTEKFPSALLFMAILSAVSWNHSLLTYSRGRDYTSEKLWLVKLRPTGETKTQNEFTFILLARYQFILVNQFVSKL